MRKNPKAAARKTVKRNVENKPLEKRYTKDGSKCKVTFRLPKEATVDVRKVNLVGEFNNWSIEQTPLKQLKSGEFKVTMDLEPGREYRFRFLLDGDKWENHWNADKYVQNEYGTEDSVAVV